MLVFKHRVPDQLSVFNEQDRIRSIQSLQEEMHTQLANENVIIIDEQNIINFLSFLIQMRFFYD